MSLDRAAGWRLDNMGRALSVAAALFEGEVLSTVQQGEFAWVTPVQLALFRNLDLDGTHLTELAARARITKQSMQELVDKAQRFGVVTRRPDPHDRRIKIVAFTPTGLRMLERFRDAVAEAERRMADALGEEGLHALRARLTAYVAASERPEPAAVPADRPRPPRTAPAPQRSRAKLRSPATGKRRPEAAQS